MARIGLGSVPPPVGSYSIPNAREEGEVETRHGSKNAVAVIVLATISTLAISALLSLLIYYYHVRRKVVKQKKSSSSSSHQVNCHNNYENNVSQVHGPNSTAEPPHSSWNKDSIHLESQAFPLKVLQGATSNFDPDNVVGHGGFGSVYRGVLPDGRIVAIKQLDRGSKQGDHEFRIEVEILSHLHSPYLVGLIGYCADQDHRLLVYEYMANGNLQEHLYSDGISGKPPVLDWDTRMRIALDSARGLEYLHECVTPPVIHRDLKSSNILLDSNFSAKVADFGLAKLGSDQLGGLISTRVLGTHGYVAPEYALTGHLTTKSDVYSYGVVLLELITGRVPVDMKRPPGQGVLVTWALPRLTDRDKLMEIVDPVMAGQFTVKDLIQVAAIAAMCVQPEADYRPLMTDVVQSLIPLVKQKKGTTNVVMKLMNRRSTPNPHHNHSLVSLKSSSIDSGQQNSSSSSSSGTGVS